MALSVEWQHRIERWQTAIWNACYRPLADISLSGFATRDRLTAEQALQLPFTPMPPGVAWGGKWEYGWFRSSITLPPEAQGQRMVLRLSPGGESLVWVNGEISGSVGWAHREITLTRVGQAGTQFEILLEAYAGHGRITVGEGPVMAGVQTVPEPGPTQASVGQSTYGVWLEPIYQLALDFTTLYELRNRLDPSLLRVAEVDEGLMASTLLFDPELPEDEMIETACQARQLLRPLLEKQNGPTMPLLHAFGNAHLDVAWLWPWTETERKMARTEINQLALSDEYDEYRFLQSQAHLYWMLQDRYPDLYQRVKKAVSSGKFIIDGAMWVESDTNLAGGEALIRQVIYGRRFFRDEFGVDSRVLWLPDVFGYSGALPQILKRCGCIGFATQKITWAYNGGEPFPYNTFWWEGIDGSAIPTHIYTEYTSHTRPNAIFDRWNTRLQKNGIRSMIFAFGWGDGGGGPTRDHVEFMRRAKNLEGLPRVKYSSPLEFFMDLEQQGLPKERYVGELYFQAHRGTYTSQAKTKQGNRRSEFALREAELWGSLARVLRKYDFPSKTITTAWRNLLLCQFHDVLPGSSIQRVYEDAESTLAEVIAAAQGLVRSAAAAFIRPAQRAQTIFNSLNWPRTVLVNTEAGTLEVTVPSCGWTTIDVKDSSQVENGVIASSDSLENEFLRLKFNTRGEITSIFDKDSEREVLAGPGNQFRLYKDVPDTWDAWDLDSMYELQPVKIDEPVVLEILEAGPLVARLKLARKLSQSQLTQVITLRRNSRRLEFATTIDWKESHKLLKVAFPVNIHAHEALHEIQFGHLSRPNHRSRPYDTDRFEVCNHKWTALAEQNRGVAVLNDCKYGVNVLGNTIQLTLLKSPLAPDMNADKGVQTFTYALFPWNGSLADSNVVREAYELNTPILVVPGDGGQGSLIQTSVPNIILETVKPAEDGSNDIVLRLYEAKRMATRCTLTLGLPVQAVFETDMMEERQVPLPFARDSVALEFRPFEIKTVRLKI